MGAEELAKTKYKLFKGVLVAGALLAILVLLNSIQNYQFVSKRIVVEQTRRDLNRRLADFDADWRSVTPGDARQLQAVTEKMAAGKNICWVSLRDKAGKLLAYQGLEANPSFRPEELSDRFQRREPAFQIRQVNGKHVLAETFPVRLGGAQGIPASIEIASDLDQAGVVFWPLRRNVLINSSAALALLGALAFLAFRFQSYVKGRHLEQQLEIARTVQQNLLPRNSLSVPGLEMSAVCVPAWRVGGDFYDVFDAGENRRAVVLGDVSGKGLPASLLMGVLHGAIRSSAWTDSRTSHEASTRRLNELLCSHTTGERFASLFWGYFDPELQQLRYVNAGHCSPVVLRASQSRAEVITLEAGGPVLGLLRSVPYQQGCIDLEPGDLIALFSDGLVEAANRHDEEFGVERLSHLILDHRHLPAQSLRRLVLEELYRFTGTRELADDLTILLIRYQPSFLKQNLVLTELARTA